MPELNRMYTIGYGARETPEFLAELKEHGIEYLVDVRSVPGSRFKPEFSQEHLSKILAREGIKYVFMGDLLGGRPDDPSCYVKGKVDYGRVRESVAFQRGIRRLLTAYEKGLRVVLMCSEGRPEECHRSKLIGSVLLDSGVTLEHITADGSLLGQEEVLHLLTGGQEDLFGRQFTSRKVYLKDADEVSRDESPDQKCPAFVTIGVYGFTEESFFGSLGRAQVDLLIDVRQRRGVRGKKYAFANSRRLQERLSDLGIDYLYKREWAPSEEMRNLQKDADEEQGVLKRSRQSLSDRFREAYTRDCLDQLNPEEVLREALRGHRAVAFLCVEEEPAACHRTLIAEFLSDALSLPLTHLKP